MSELRNPATGERPEGFEDEARENLRALGIESLDDLVKRWSPRVTREDHLLMMPTAGGDGQLAPRPHTPPQVRVVIDGEVNEPRTVREFDGQPLYSTPGFRDGEVVLYMFTSMDMMVDHLRTHSVEPPLLRHEPMLDVTDPNSGPENATYFSDIHLGGDWLYNGPGAGWSVLSEVGRGFLHFGDWNDVISSVDQCKWHVTLFEHRDRGGSRFEIRAGLTINHLGVFGWDDRASSTFNWGRRF
ncbi:hypothetical protein ACWEQW_05735 [Streptomyces nigra]